MAQEKRKWLTNVFDSEYFAFWMAITCLVRYKDTAAHQYLCFKIFQTRKREVLFYFPQLFHLMLIEKGSIWNRPIFRMLYKITQTERHFGLVLGMYSLSIADTFPPGDERHKVCIELVYLLMQTKKSIQKSQVARSTTTYIKYLRMTYGSKVGLSPSTKEMLTQQKEFYSLPSRTLTQPKRATHSLKAIISALLSGVVSMFDKDQQSFLIDAANTYGVYSSRKESRVKNALKKCTTALERHTAEAQFITKLNVISNSLIPVQKTLRTQALVTDLNLINLYLPERVCLPLLCTGEHTNILKVSVVFSKLLDSAARAPFMLVYECSKEEDLPKNISQMPSPQVYAADLPEPKTSQKQETKDMILKTAIKILGGLKELDSSAQVDLDILSIKTKVIKKIYDMYTPAHIVPPKRNTKHKEEWHTLVSFIKDRSPYKAFHKWQVQSLITKTGSDMKQEQLTTQILKVIKDIWSKHKIDLFIHPYSVMVTGKDSGLIETITGARSIHQIKKLLKEKAKPQSLVSYFNEEWEDSLEKTKEEFFKSLVGYSLVSFILQIKDRHNGNILIDGKGRMVHIDFGFVLGTHPGFYSVESAPFKFSVEYAEIIGEARMGRFKEEFLRGFLSLRKNMDHIITLVESIAQSEGIPSVTMQSTDALKERFQPGLTEEEFQEYTSDIVSRGMKNVFTDIYDSFQYYTQGYCR